jgi:hypothetical protein
MLGDPANFYFTGVCFVGRLGCFFLLLVPAAGGQEEKKTDGEKYDIIFVRFSGHDLSLG